MKNMISWMNWAEENWCLSARCPSWLFGNPAVNISTQAPFHMGFYHQSALVYLAAPFVARTYPLLRVHQFFGLAELALRTGHPYWGWRLAGNAAHYVQDLT
jgi:hypothetical protein